jgi:glycosyltransferase involved in cell wall biosynthesis
MITTTTNHLICFSHLRWDFVYQRPQHLMTRFAKQFTVYFIEEPAFGAEDNHLEIVTPSENLLVVTPRLRDGQVDEQIVTVQKDLLKKLFHEKNIEKYFFWYYTPMMLSISDDFKPSLIVYDCIDEVTTFKFAPHGIKEKENELFAKADLVFTGGYSLYEAKKHRHAEVHPFPSSIDTEHYFKARLHTIDPADQAPIPHPRIGYFGVIDDRIDMTLLEGIARRKPEWHIVMVGPVARINPDSLPKFPNIHYLGMKHYSELPSYISGWDIAMMPFAHNESTRYISPTKTPEYLAAGKPVISTPIIDVLRQYGRSGLVNIAGTPEEFVRVASIELENSDRDEWMQHVNEFLSHNSWDKTWQRMSYLLTRKLNDKDKRANVKTEVLA